MLGGEGGIHCRCLFTSAPEQLKKTCITKYSLELVLVIVLGLWIFSPILFLLGVFFRGGGLLGLFH